MRTVVEGLPGLLRPAAVSSFVISVSRRSSGQDRNRAGAEGPFEDEVVEFRDGGDPDVVRKVPGQLKWGDIELEGGITPDSSLWQWRRMVESDNIAEGQYEGKARPAGSRLPRGDLGVRECLAVQDLRTGAEGRGDDVAIEEIIIDHEGMLRE